MLYNPQWEEWEYRPQSGMDTTSIHWKIVMAVFVSWVLFTATLITIIGLLINP